MFLGHYYGDTVRKLFLSGGVVMLMSLPFLQSFIPYPLFVSILSILVLVLCAGLIAPPKKGIALLDTVVAGVAMATFEYYAVTSYMGEHMAFFWVNQLLAAIFLSAFYYAVKTMRGAFGKGSGMY